MKKSSI